MNQNRIRVRVFTWSLVALVALVVGSAETRACEWLDNLMPWNWCRRDNVVASTTYTPPYASVAAAPVAAPAVSTTCTYIPQTFYRTAYQTVPVTSCYPVVSRDPCTGCPCTVYQPVTSMVRQARLIPYTTYQAVYTADPCATVTAAPPSADCCGTSVPYYSPSQAAPVSPIPATPAPALPADTLPSTPSNSYDPSGTRRSYQPSTDPNATETRLKPPVPTREEDDRPSSSAPALIDPTSNTAMRETRQAAYLRPVSNPGVSDSGGWRASRD